MRLLWVENHAQFADIARKTFLMAHTVTIVPSLAEATLCLATEGFEAVLLDYDLDDGKGTELFPCLDALPVRPAIVATSSHAEGNARLLQAGADAICSKRDFKHIEAVLTSKKCATIRLSHPTEASVAFATHEAIMTIQTGTYPDYLGQVKELVEQHLELDEEPLLLAIYYAPDRNENDVFLFEVLDGFQGASIEYDGDMIEVTYGTTPHFALPSRESVLHIILTSPEELHQAKEKKTPRFTEIKQAFALSRAQVVYAKPHAEYLRRVFE